MKKTHFTFLTFVIIASHLFAEDSLKRINFSINYKSEFFTNMRGGLKEGSTYQGLAGLNVSFSSDGFKLWKGGLLNVYFINVHGGNPSADYIGDFQVASNIEHDNLYCFQELWFGQEFEKFKFTVGLQDANANFFNSELASLHLNSSFGVPSVISSNVHAPIFPLTSVGMSFQYKLNDKASLKAAIFDGCPDDFENNPYNLKYKFRKEDGAIAFLQFDVNKAFNLNKRNNFKVGGFYHNHIEVEDMNHENIKQPNYGGYLITDYDIFKLGDKTTISTFFQSALTSKTRSFNWYYLGYGVQLSGFTNCEDDALGLGVAHAGFRSSKDEIAIEFTLLKRVNKYLSLQPDFQYIIKPSGKLKNALVSFLRMNLQFSNN